LPFSTRKSTHHRTRKECSVISPLAVGAGPVAPISLLRGRTERPPFPANVYLVHPFNHNPQSHLLKAPAIKQAIASPTEPRTPPNLSFLTSLVFRPRFNSSESASLQPVLFRNPVSVPPSDNITPGLKDLPSGRRGNCQTSAPQLADSGPFSTQQCSLSGMSFSHRGR